MQPRPRRLGATRFSHLIDDWMDVLYEKLRPRVVIETKKEEPKVEKDRPKFDWSGRCLTCGHKPEI